MKRLPLALLLLAPGALAQTVVVGPPAGLSVTNPSGGNCAPGYPSLLYTATGGIYTCQGSTYQASGGGSNTATVSSTSGVSTFNVFADAKVAMTAAYTALSSTGGTTATALTTHDNDAGGEYLQIGAAGPANALMTLSSSQVAVLASAAFKTTGTVPSPTCWGINNTGGSSGTVTVAITPTGGSGHILMAMARSTIPGGSNTITFSDPNNIWTNILGAPAGSPAANTQMQVGYATNIIGGSYTLTATFSQTFNSPSIYACEFSNIATSSPLDGFGIPYPALTSTTAATGGFSTTAANDLVVAMGTNNSTTATWSAGPIGFTSTVTTQSSDPAFTSADVGKKFLGSTNCASGNGFMNCQQSFFPGVIATVSGAHTATVNGLPTVTNSTTATAFTGWFVWGHDDGAQIKAAWTAALAIPGSTLFLPCGSMLIGQPPFLSTSAGSVYNPNISGCVGTTLIPTADFNYSLASGGIIYSYPNTNQAGFSNTLFQNPYIWSVLSNFTIWGAGIDGKQQTVALPMFSLFVTTLQNVWVVGWDADATVAANSMPAFQGQSIVMRNSGNWASGTGGIVITGDQSPTNLPSSLTDCFFGSQGASVSGSSTNRGDGLVLQTGSYLSTKNVSFNPADGAQHGHGATVSGGWWTSVGDQIGLLNVTGAGRIFLKGSTTALLSSNGITNAGGAISSQDTQIQANSLTQTSGSFTDQGGNYSCATSTVTPCSGAISAWSVSGSSISGGTYATLSPTTVFSTGSYTNATTTLSNVTGLSIPVVANTNYTIDCNLIWQGSATTTGPKWTFTGPASPTSVNIGVHSQVTATTINAGVSTAFGTSVNNTGTITAATNFMDIVRLALQNGANSGTVQLQAAANGVGTLTVQNGSWCRAQ